MTCRTNRIASTSTTHVSRGARVAPWLVLNLLAAAVGSAWAQSVPAPAAAASAPAPKPPAKADAKAATAELDTVTISATRRSELIREVPLSISSIPAERLQEVGAKGLNDYLATQPGVVLQNSGAADDGGFIIIRGLTAGNDSNSPTTVYIDDTPLAPNATFDINLLDLRSFEVLRGPQGTLYGSSAMGGIVKYLTNEPDTYELSGKVNLGLSQTQHGGLNSLESGVVNVPLKQDFAALRIAVFGTRDGGYVDATGPAGRDRVNRKDSNGGRISLLITPNRDLSIKLSAMTQTRNSDGNNRISYDIATHQPAAGDLVYSGLYIAEPRTTKRDIYSATIEYDLQWARFSSITSHQTASEHLLTDFTPLAGLFGLSTGYSDAHTSNSKTTQEFRLVSQSAGAIQWLAGAFFDKTDTDTHQLLLGTAGAAPVTFGDQGGTRDYKEYALYGNVTWNVMPDLALTGGLRIAHYKQTDSNFQTGGVTQTIPFGETPKTYLLTAKYRLTPQSNLYVRAANGYRPGGANLSSVDANNQPIPGAPLSYGTDTAWTYEAGYKASFPDTGTSLEVAVFDTEWKNLQQFTQGPLIGFTSNLGKARIRGIEAAATLKPMQGLVFGASLSLMDPKLLTDSPGLGGQAGDRLPNSPKIAAAITSRYAFELASRPAYAGLNVIYQGDRNSSFENSPLSPNYVLPSYVQADLSAGINLGRFDLGLYVRNLTDKRGQLGGDTSETLSVNRTYIRVIDPRTFGINLSAAF
jgi:outer membrane receptor protein involved in Fe transport